jgi:hypothetical protein
MNSTKEYAQEPAQIEVWSWKQSIHEEIKDFELSEGLKHILEKAGRTMEEQYRLKNIPTNAA